MPTIVHMHSHIVHSFGHKRDSARAFRHEAHRLLDNDDMRLCILPLDF